MQIYTNLKEAQTTLKKHFNLNQIPISTNIILHLHDKNTTKIYGEVWLGRPTKHGCVCLLLLLRRRLK